jgi:hypothetical protein
MTLAGPFDNVAIRDDAPVHSFGFSSHDPVVWGMTDRTGCCVVTTYASSLLHPTSVRFEKTGFETTVRQALERGAQYWQTTRHTVTMRRAPPREAPQ